MLHMQARVAQALKGTLLHLQNGMAPTNTSPSTRNRQLKAPELASGDRLGGTRRLRGCTASLYAAKPWLAHCLGTSERHCGQLLDASTSSALSRVSAREELK
jgi:hypothetical protein